MISRPSESEAPSPSLGGAVTQGGDLSGIVGPVILAFAAAILLACGVMGVGRNSRPFDDFSYLYAAGQVWLNGESAYNAAVFGPVIHHYITHEQVDSFFAYPPTFVPFAEAMALLPYQVAAWVFALVNLLAAGALAWWTVLLVTDAHQRRPASDSRWTPWLVAALVIGNPFTATAIWSGQTTLIAAALLVGGWYLASRGEVCLGIRGVRVKRARWVRSAVSPGKAGAMCKVWAGILLGIACIKPQFVVLVFVWLVLDRQWRVVVVAAITALVLAAFAFATHGVAASVGGWLHNVTLYQGGPTNTLGSGFVVGLPSLMVAMGLPAVPLWAAFAVIVALTIALWLTARQACQDDVPGILLAMPVVLVFGHWYDLVLLAPLAAGLWRHLWHRRWIWPVAAGFILLLFCPNRPVKMLNMPLLLHWRSMLTLIALLVSIYLYFSDGFDASRQRLRRGDEVVIASMSARFDRMGDVTVLDRPGQCSGRLGDVAFGGTGGGGGKRGYEGGGGGGRAASMRERELISTVQARSHEQAARTAPAASTTYSQGHEQAVAMAVSVVMPIFNEAPIIEHVFASVLAFAQRHDAYEFLFVDDGSTDATATILHGRIKAAGMKRIRLIRMSHNQGKGAAMKRGYEESQGQAILFTDGDLAYSLDHLPRMLDALRDHDMVIGSRQLQRREANERSLSRTILGETFNCLVRTFMRLPYRDTQAGLKGFSRKAAEQLFPHTRVFRYSTDVELLFLAHKRGLKIGQIAARVDPGHAAKESSINLLGDPPQMFWDMIRIHFNSLRGRYD